MLTGVMLMISPCQLMAEPYLSVFSGFKCMLCHTNPSGGGKRSSFGRQYAFDNLSATVSDNGDFWSGSLGSFVFIGGDLRTDYTQTQVGGQESISEFSLQENNLYIEVMLIPNRVTFYVDEKLGPGTTENREAYGLFRFENSSFYIKAGRMFLPYGLRLQDDTAFIRNLSGINFNYSDTGVEFGFEKDAWTTHLAVSNGSGTNSDNNDEKQVSVLGRYTASGWQLGASFNTNEALQSKRRMYNVFGGFKTGSIAWLAEIDIIKDELALIADTEQTVMLMESNIKLRKGQYLKVSYEQQTVDSAGPVEAKRDRLSLVWEYFPVAFTQFRLGLRAFEGEITDIIADRDEFFAEWHIYY